VITGFNTDVEHDGVVYHVQTEDKGLDSPIILSLVYSGGAILASKRSPYKDLIASGFTDEALSDRLKRQHRLICAAIHSGRLNELKKMSGRDLETAASDGVSLSAPVDAPTEGTGAEQPVAPAIPAASEPAEGHPTAEDEVYSVHDPRRKAAEAEVGTPEEGLVISLLDDQEFSSGESPTLRVLVSNRSGKDAKPMGSVTVSVKILGTTFRPQIYTLKTQKDGVATVSAEIPHFTSGRAAVLIRVVTKGSAAELRRVIHPGK
jgi:hypothetical protein